MDELDGRLIIKLAKEAGQSCAELSPKLGILQTTVWCRIQHLQEHGVLTLQPYLILPSGDDIMSIAIVALEVDPGSIDVVSESVAICPNARCVSLCTGKHGIFAGVGHHQIRSEIS